MLSGTSTNTLKDLTVVMPTAGDKANNGKYPSINIDDMVVMSVATGTGTTVTVPNAKTVTDDKTFNTTSTVATPVPDTAAPGMQLRKEQQQVLQSTSTTLPLQNGH